MIIFNLVAIPVGIAIVLVMWAVGYFWPSAVTPPLLWWTYGLVTLGVGGVAELAGLRARLFFLPVWLIGVGLVAYKIGLAGSIAFVGLVVAGLIWSNRKTKKTEAATWEKLRYVSRTLPLQTGRDETAVWEWVQATLFLPLCTVYTPEICAHNLAVLKSLRESGVSLNAEEKATLRAQEEFLEQAPAELKLPGVDGKVYSAMNRLIETRLRQAREKPRPAAGVTPSSVSPAASDQAVSGADAPPNGAVDIDVMWGGYYAARDPEDGKFHVFRLLDFQQEAYHAALFRETFADLPTLAAVTALSPGIGHAPMASGTLLTPPIQLLGAVPLTPADLEGYLIYLEHGGTSADERSALATRLISFSYEPPLRLRLIAEGHGVKVTSLPKNNGSE